MDAVKPVQEALSPVLIEISDILGVDHSTSLIILSNLIAIVVLCLILVCVRGGKSGKRTGLVLTGLSDSGKTRMFAELVGAHGAESYASIKENVMSLVTRAQTTAWPGYHGKEVLRQKENPANRKILIRRCFTYSNEITLTTKEALSIGGKTWKLVDVPGSERIRMLILQRFLPEAKGIVFVIDSCRFTKEAKDVAEYLYEILSDPAMKYISVLIACNKQDLGLAKSARIIRSTLEKEFCFLTKSRLASLDSTDDSGGATKRCVLGRGDPGSFSFDELKPQHNIEFVECTAAITNGHKKADLAIIEEWCASL